MRQVGDQHRLITIPPANNSWSGVNDTDRELLAINIYDVSVNQTDSACALPEANFRTMILKGHKDATNTTGATERFIVACQNRFGMEVHNILRKEYILLFRGPGCSVDL
jgi:hypothetical protein